MLSRTGLGIGIFLSLGLSLSQGQLTEATLKGTVRDAQEQMIAGSTVKATNQGTGLSRNVLSDQSGAFVMPGLPPGLYTVTVQAKNFKTFDSRDIRLNVGQTSELEVSLEVGQVTETVEVSASIAAVPLIRDARLADNFGQSQLVDLPVPQRDVFGLPKLSAGATAIPGAANSTKLTNSPVITVNGNRYRGNEICAGRRHQRQPE
ncbi:MAG: carboxypeptidase-like regulatory domain-containing protein [Bryobacteraceae bacterium]